MKIAFVYDIPYPWHKGGLEQILNVEARELAKKHDVHFFTMRWPGMKGEFTYQKVKYHAFGKATEEDAYKHGRRAIREALMFSVYARNLFKYDFDVIITNAFPILHLPAVKAYCRIKNAKLILKVDEIWDRKYWASYLGVIAGNMANVYANSLIRSSTAKYVANSSMTAKNLEKLGIARNRIREFAPVLEDSLLDEIRRSAKRRNNRIIFSGRLIKEKRIDKWLRVVKQVIERYGAAEAMLVGEGIERAKIMKEARRLGLRGSIVVRPFFKEKRELYEAIAESKVLLHMGEREGLSIITLESLALNTPVVVPEYSPIPEEVKEMCVVEKEERLADKIIRIMKGDPEEYISNKDNLKMFSTSNVVSFYENLLEN